MKLKVSSSRLGVVTNIVFFLQWAHSCLSSLLHNHEFVWYSIFTKSTKVDGSLASQPSPKVDGGRQSVFTSVVIALITDASWN